MSSYGKFPQPSNGTLQMPQTRSKIGQKCKNMAGCVSHANFLHLTPFYTHMFSFYTFPFASSMTKSLQLSNGTLDLPLII